MALGVGGDAVSAPQVARSVFPRPCRLGGFSDAGPPDLVRIPATCAPGIVPASHDRCEFLVGSRFPRAALKRAQSLCIVLSHRLWWSLLNFSCCSSSTVLLRCRS